MLPTQVKNDNAYKARQRDMGMKRITLMAPEENHEELKEIAKIMREERKAFLEKEAEPSE